MGFIFLDYVLISNTHTPTKEKAIEEIIWAVPCMVGWTRKRIDVQRQTNSLKRVEE